VESGICSAWLTEICKASACSASTRLP